MLHSLGLFNQLREDDLEFSLQEYREFLIADIEDMLSARNISFSVFDYGVEMDYGGFVLACETLERVILKALEQFEPRLLDPVVRCVQSSQNNVEVQISGYVFYHNREEYIFFCIYS